ncbi:MAG: hypothetical protein ACI8YQ_000109 [Polaribacter sp.]
MLRIRTMEEVNHHLPGVATRGRGGSTMEDTRAKL